MMYNNTNNSSDNNNRELQQQKDISFYASCPPHQAKKALIMADKLREQSHQEAEKKMTERLHSLQQQLTNSEKKNRELKQTLEELHQKRV